MSLQKPFNGIDSVRKTFHYCPGCGRENPFVYRENRILCQSCGFSYYINPPAAVIALLVTEEEKLLLSRRKKEPFKDKYDLPGGFVSLGESLEEALQREIREELNLEITDLEYFGSYTAVYPFEGLIYQPVDTAFKCIVKDWATLKTGDDVQSVCFRSVFDLLDDELAFSSNNLIIKQLRADMAHFKVVGQQG